MGETLTQRRRVSDEVFRDKTLSRGTIMTVPLKEAPANYAPAAAVIRRGRALPGIIGHKERVGGNLSQMLNSQA